MFSSNKFYFSFFAILILLSFSSLFAANETLTITTYYPSPYGSYNNLTVANRLGIGTTAPTSPFHIRSTVGGAYGDGMRIERYESSTQQTLFTVDATGFYITDASNVGVRLNWAATAWVANSDIRTKKNIETINNALDKVASIRGVYFNWKDEKASKARQVGVVAQELEKSCPEIVSSDEKGYKSVAYSMLTPYLIEAIKEQQKEIKDQGKRIGELEQEIQQLKLKKKGR